MDTLFANEIHGQENANIPVGIMFEEVCLVLSIVFEVTLRMDQFMEAMQIRAVDEAIKEIICSVTSFKHRFI